MQLHYTPKHRHFTVDKRIYIEIWKLERKRYYKVR